MADLDLTIDLPVRAKLSERMREFATWRPMETGETRTVNITTTGDPLLSFAFEVLALEARLAAAEGVVEKLQAALHPGPVPTVAVDNGSLFRHGSCVGEPPGPWCLVLDTSRPHRLEWAVWIDRANRYEQLTGLKADELSAIVKGEGK